VCSSDLRPDASIGEWLKHGIKGIIFLSPNENSLQTLQALAGEAMLFVELRPGMAESKARTLAKNLNRKLVATGDIYFMQPQDARHHKVLRAIENNTTLSHLKPGAFKTDTHFFRNEEQMVSLFPNSLQAINNSYYIAQRCKTDWSYGTIFPAVSQAVVKLRKMVYAGAKERYSNVTKEVRERIEYEFSIIIPKGFAPYFLVVADLVSQTSANIGRGSGAASILSYCLKITQVDPLKYNLQFERFIHPERVNMPDIDVDFPWDERDNIFDYAFKKYGEDRSAMVSNQVFLKPKSAIRQVSKVFGLSNEEINSVTKQIGRAHV